MHLLCVALHCRGDECLKQITLEAVGFSCTVRGDVRVNDKNDEGRIVLVPVVPAGGGGQTLPVMLEKRSKAMSFGMSGYR